MKLQLSSQEGIDILSGTGEISVHDLEILRAGLTKLLKSGRNRIVLELAESETIPPELIRELSKFDILARELSGRVVLAGSNEKLRARVKQFAQPPIIECFDGKDLAVQHFRAKAKAPAPPPLAAPTPAPAATAPATPASDASAQPAPGSDPQQYKADIRQKEITDLLGLRKRVSQLENENQLIMKQLHSAWLTSRTLPTEQAHQGQIESLNQRMEEILALTKAAKPGA